MTSNPAHTQKAPKKSYRSATYIGLAVLCGVLSALALIAAVRNSDWAPAAISLVPLVAAWRFLSMRLIIDENHGVEIFNFFGRELIGWRDIESIDLIPSASRGNCIGISAKGKRYRVEAMTYYFGEPLTRESTYMKLLDSWQSHIG